MGNIKIKSSKFPRYLLITISIILGLLGVFFKDTSVLLYSILGLLLHNIWFCTEKFYERVIFLFFNFTFFIFLIGRLVVKFFTNYVDPYNDNIYGLDFTELNVILTIFIALLLSLLFLYLGYSTFEKNTKQYVNGSILGFNKNAIMIASLFVFVLTFFIEVIYVIDQLNFVQQFGYSEIYSSFESNLPFIFVKLAEMNTPAFFMFLGTLPDKKIITVPALMYISIGVLYLLIGRRNEIMLNILIVIVYLCLRRISSNDKSWFNGKHITVLLLLLPVLMIILNLVVFIRSESADQNIDSYWHLIADFLYRQGVSINLIGYAQTLTFQDGKFFSLGRLIDYLVNNTISQLLFDLPTYSSQTIDSVIHGNSFADTVSYQLSPGAFERGWGYGSSYVAEFLKDFGIPGVTIGNFIMGTILAIVHNGFGKNVVISTLTLSMIRLLFYAPRDTFLSFLVTSFNMINILTVILILLLSTMISSLLFNKKQLEQKEKQKAIYGGN